jgi:ribosome recycling factor
MIANIGFNPMNNGDLIIIAFLRRGKKTWPCQTGKVESEDAKVGIRNAHEDANTEIKN